MIRISQLKLPVGHSKTALEKKMQKTLHLQNQPFTYQIKRQSLDSRHKEDKKFVYTIDVKTDNENRILKKVHDKNITSTAEKTYHFPKPGTTPLHSRPVIVGSGPAGLMCAWYLAKAGYAPLLLERGEEAHLRQQKVETFWKNGVLDPDSNVQFGEGGAGTFSDGKLNTLVKDTFGRNQEVLRRFVEAGAGEEILYQQKPHLGTDMLVGIVEKLRNQIQEMGGTVRFHSKVTDLIFQQDKLQAVQINHQEIIPAQICVLAIGHSARDTFGMLYEKGLYMEAKSFAVGLRIQHPQTMINQAMYGEEDNSVLGPASYKVTHTCENKRGVYSFCMCPGGYVVNASSEEQMLAVNGMSYQARDSENANSVLVAFKSNIEESKPEWVPFQSNQGNVNLYDSAWQRTQARILSSHNIPSASLCGLPDVSSSGFASDSQKLETAFQLYERLSGNYHRQAIVKSLNDMFKLNKIDVEIILKPLHFNDFGGDDDMSESTKSQDTTQDVSTNNVEEKVEQ